MLARVANNLFWMGRYIERSEHLARYLNVNYFSSLDAPNEISGSRQFVLRSIMYMAGNEIIDSKVELKEEDVLYNVGLNMDKPYSILASINNAHNNAKSSRDIISTELFESINKINHSVKDYSASDFVKNGLYDFTLMITKSTSELRSKIGSTLLHDEVYAIIMLGIYFERALQVTRIINAKYSDASVEKAAYGELSVNNYQWTTLLKCVSTYDMMRRFYKKTPTRNSTLEFLILNSKCPRSIKSCLNQIHKYITILSKNRAIPTNSAAFLIGKINAEFDYKLIEDIDDNLEDFISELISNLILIGEKLEEDYFKITDTIAKIENKKTQAQTQ
tara:strand:- start:7549 stop:8547 length:999 start_codon:yes stop_codon:yes gene_type:complete